MNDSTNEKSGKVAGSGPERRRYERRRIRLDARVTGAGGESYSYEIHDYCAGGMLLARRGKATGYEAPPKRGDEVELLTKVLTPKGRVRIRVKARINWVDGELAGARFLRPSSKLVNALIEHKRLLRGANRLIEGLDGGQRHSLQSVEPAVVAGFRGIFRGMLVNLSRELAEAAVKPISAEARSQLFRDMNAVKASKPDWPDLMARQLFSDALGDPGTAVRKDVALHDIKLRELEEFERWLESAKTATELEAEFSEVLAQIGQALSHTLASPSKDAALDVPFNPRQVITVLLDYAKEIGLETVSRRILYQVAEQELVKGLPSVYDTVLAKLQENRTTSVESAGDQLRDAGSSGALAAGEPEIMPPASVPAGESPTGHPAGFVPHADAGKQQEQHRLACAQELVGYLDQCAIRVRPGKPAWLGRIERLLIESLRVDVRALQLTDSPLRKIVDGLDHLQLFSTDNPRATEEQAVAQRIETWLAALETASVDGSILTLVAAEISEILQELSGRYQRQIEYVVAESENRQQYLRAQADVADILNRRYAGKSIPEVVHELLAVGWRSVLVRALLSDRETGQAFLHRIGVLDAVCESLGDTAPAQHRSPDTNADLLGQIRDQLATAAFDRLQRDAVERRLREELAAREKRDIKRVEFPERSIEEVSAAFARPEGIQSKHWRDALSKVDGFAVGDVLRQKVQGTFGATWRIAWIDEEHARFSLVDGDGAFVADMTAARLAQLWHSDQLLHVAEACRPLSVRALAAMLQRMERQLEHQAYRDSLTGLPNRSQFQAQLMDLCGANKHASGPKVLMWIDVDGFRLINEIHGYATGDSYLVSLARLLKDLFGDAVVVGHVGGDRFAVLLPRTEIEDAFDEARSACEEIARTSQGWGSSSLRITASIGVVALDDLDAGVQHLLLAGEAAARAAKARGGNQAKRYRVVADTTPPRRGSNWDAQIDEAMRRGKLQLRCQPIVPLIDLPDRRPYYEVLLGIQNAAGEALPIGEFISAAELGHRMAAMDRWITRTVIEWIQAKRERMAALGGFAINLSVQTLVDPDYPKFLDELLTRCSIPAELLSFELAENAVIGHPEAALAMIERLRASGCRVALDDVGSSASSYAYLNELSVDAIKIDGVFVRNIATNEDDLAVVRSINDIGHFLGKQTIAEYATDRAVLRQLTEVGVDFAQGYAISPPVRMTDLAD
jgi:diguanylate cyclase (GGDEF)-like protein